MRPDEQKMTDQRLEIILGTLLRAGVVISAIIVLAGGVWYLIDAAGAPAGYQTFHPVADPLGNLAKLSRPEIVIAAGLLLLIATPITRVFFSLVGFALEGDRTYVVLTLLVLGVLLYSVVYGLMGW